MLSYKVGPAAGGPSMTLTVTISDEMHELVHDLRSPLAAIEAAAQAVLGIGVDQPAVRRLINLVAIEARCAQVMVDSALDGQPPRDTVRVAGLLAMVADRSSTRWGGVVHVEGPGLEDNVHGDQSELARAIGNLVDNAFQHGGCAQVRLQAHRRGRWLVIRVAGASALPPPKTTSMRSHGIGLQSVDRLLAACGGHHKVLTDSSGRVDEIHLPLSESGTRE